MDSDTQSVRVEERLKIHIGEAKNLPSRSHGSVGLRDASCTININQEEIYRTTTVEKNLCPFYGEEFNFEVPHRFRYLSVYVHDHDNKKDKIIGKVSIKKNNLHKYHGKDHWFPLIPVDADSEVQGKVHIDLRIGNSHYNHGKVYKLLLKIIECNDLQILHGACDPYVQVQLVFGQTKLDSKRTKVKKKTICPQYDETFVFELPICVKGVDNEFDIYSFVEKEMHKLELKIVVMHDSSVFGNVFLGEVKIPLQSINLRTGHNAWYFLKPRENHKASSPDLGSLRLKIFYTSDHVFSSQFYDPLRKLLLHSTSVEPVTSSAAYVLGQIVSNKVDAALPLVKAFLHHGQIIPFLTSLAHHDMSRVTDLNTIFRGNTLMSKCMDEFMKLVGLRYLHKTLKPIVDKIISERKSCEIDPSRLKSNECIKENLDNLYEYANSVFHAIMDSAPSCPLIMCKIFSELKNLATVMFLENPCMRYVAISSFIFLRFFAPAILGPKLFDLTTEQIDQMTCRTFTLISKSLQNLGNHVSFKVSPNIIKEDYMCTFNKMFVTSENSNAVKVFLEIISSVSSNCDSKDKKSCMLKESIMIKRSQGRRFRFRNFKKRYFCLTNQELSYAKSKGDPPLCVIPMDEIRAVEKLQENSFKMKNMFQVVQKEHTLYIQANHCVELNSWIDLIHKVIQSNNNKLSVYHPAAYVNGQWPCCGQIHDVDPGCSPVSSLSTDITLTIDSDREIERIHSLFLANMSKLETLEDLCENEAVYTGNKTSVSSLGFEIDDTQSLWETLNAIRTCVISLEQDHKQYMKTIQRRTKYGSKHAPYGGEDDLSNIDDHTLL